MMIEILFKRFSLAAAVFLLMCGLGREVPAQDIPVKHSVDKKIRIAIVLDDVGNTKNEYQNLESIGFPVTIAILPSVTFTELYYGISNPNVEKIVHLPMESRIYPGPDTIYTSMSGEELEKKMEKIFAQFPDVAGFNNHEGSAFMKNEKALECVFSFASKKNLFFLNSVTTSPVLARKISSELGIHYLERNVFLDNRNTPEYIRKQFKKCYQIAMERGQCIVIGHIRQITVDVLKEIVPEYRQLGCDFVFLEDFFQERTRIPITAAPSQNKEKKQAGDLP
jgi:uncharacterized protein